MPGSSLIDHFTALEDPRQSWKVLFPLPEVLLVVLCATLAGAEDFVGNQALGSDAPGVSAPLAALQGGRAQPRYPQRRHQRP